MDDTVVIIILLISTAADSFRDSKFDPERRTAWRKALFPGSKHFAWVDLWHIAKWCEFYPPRIVVLWLLWGYPWTGWWTFGKWGILGVMGYIVWQIGKPKEWRWVK